MASRLNASPMMVMQNLYVVNGRPAWSSQYIIAMINASHKYKTELQFRVEGKGDTLSCYAYAEDQNGHIVEGPLITMDMAKAEGWVNRNGSKWKTMPEVMIRYRAASFFGRMNCPDMVMGIYSADEVIEIDENSYVVAEAVAQQEVAEQANSIPIDEAAHVDAGESEEPDGTSEPPEAPAGGPDF